MRKEGQGAGAIVYLTGYDIGFDIDIITIYIDIRATFFSTSLSNVPTRWSAQNCLFMNMYVIQFPKNKKTNEYSTFVFQRARQIADCSNHQGTSTENDNIRKHREMFTGASTDLDFITSLRLEGNRAFVLLRFSYPAPFDFSDFYCYFDLWGARLLTQFNARTLFPILTVITIIIDDYVDIMIFYDE